MNIIKKLITRISERVQETKSPCKLYSTEEAAEKALAKVSLEAVEFYDHEVDIDYVVFYVPELGKWTGAVNLTQVFNHPKFKGRYLCFVSDKGFYTFSF